MEWDPGRSQPTRPPGCPEMFAREYPGILGIYDESHVIVMYAAFDPEFSSVLCEVSNYVVGPFS